MIFILIIFRINFVMGRPKGSKNKTVKPKKLRPLKTKRKAPRKNVEVLQNIDFGACDPQSYPVCFINIDGQPYCGLIKCWNGSHTRIRVFMPLDAWSSFTQEALSRMTYPWQQNHVTITEIYALNLFLVTITRANNIITTAISFSLYKQAFSEYHYHLNLISKLFQWSLKIRNCKLIH